MQKLDVVLRILNKSPEQRDDFEIQQLIEQASQINFFKSLNQEKGTLTITRKCCQVMILQKYNKDQYVFKFGDFGDTFYIILQGSVSVQVPTKRTIYIPEGEQNYQGIYQFNSNLNQEQQEILKLYNKDQLQEIQVQEFIQVVSFGQGAAFGELALINDKPRAASIMCLSDCIFAVLQKDQFMRILGSYTDKMLQKQINFLQCLPYFKGWTKFSLQKFSFYFQKRQFNWNQIIYRQGEEVQEIFFVIKGEFKYSQLVPLIPQQNQKYSKNLRSIRSHIQKVYYTNMQIVLKGQNEILGYEEVLSNDNQREFTCQCNSPDATAFVISKKDFQQRIQNPDTIAKLRQKLEDDRKWIKQRKKQIICLEQVKQAQIFTTKVKDEKQSNQLLLTPRGYQRPWQNHIRFSSLPKSNKRPITSYFASTEWKPNKQTVHKPDLDHSNMIQQYLKQKQSHHYNQNSCERTFYSPKIRRMRRLPPPNFIARSTNHTRSIKKLMINTSFDSQAWRPMRSLWNTNLP